MIAIKAVKMMDDEGNALEINLVNEGRLYVVYVVHRCGRRTGTGLTSKFLEQIYAERRFEEQVRAARELGWEVPS